MPTGAAGGEGQGQGGGGQGQGQQSIINFVPEAYKDKDWIKQNTTSPDNFFKFVDNLNSAVGKKGLIIPGENASKDEVSAYRRGIGIPDNEDGYEFVNIDELKDIKRDPGIEKSIKKIFLDAGVPKEAAKKLQMGYEKMLYEDHKKSVELAKQQDVAFDKELTKMFGDKKDTAVANAKKLLKETIGPEIGAKLEKLDNEALIVMTAALDGIIKKYVKEDGFKGGEGAGGSGGGDTFEALSAAQRELMKSPAFRDFRHKDHQQVMDQNNALMDKMRAIKK